MTIINNKIEFHGINFHKTNKHSMSVKGVQLVETEKGYAIYNDLFSTVPIFIIKTITNKFFIFSDFRILFEKIKPTPKIDLVGFWEIILFGTCLNTRTLYTSVFQLPSASKITINIESDDFKIENYWNFNIEEATNITSIQQAAKGLFERLETIFMKLPIDQKYIMGLSGGLDSRLSLSFLAKLLKRENLSLFTFGFSDKLLEVKQAAKVAKILGYDKPHFFALNTDSYLNALDYLPQITGGQISINHSHMMEYYRNLPNRGEYTQISNYFSDALFGYASRSVKEHTLFNDLEEVRLISSNKYIPEQIKYEILQDIRLVYERYDPSANYSSFSEYKYLVERNSKFHAYLAFAHSNYVHTELVYADLDLLKYVVSLPLKYREHKQVLDCLLSMYFKSLSSESLGLVSSRGFRSYSKSTHEFLREFKNGVIFRSINSANLFLKVLSGGKLQIFNKFQTEDLDRIFYRDLKNTLNTSINYFLKEGIIDERVKNYLGAIPLRGGALSKQFSLISLLPLIQ